MVRLAADTHTARGKRHRRTVINNIVNRHGWLAECFEMRLIRTIRRQCIGKRGTTVQQRLQFGVSLGVEVAGKDEGFIRRDASDPIQQNLDLRSPAGWVLKSQVRIEQMQNAPGFPALLQTDNGVHAGARLLPLPMWEGKASQALRIHRREPGQERNAILPAIIRHDRREAPIAPAQQSEQLIQPVCPAGAARTSIHFLQTDDISTALPYHCGKL